ncbi:MAG: hypothetical protein K2X86_03385 [Cytophagaceae bacterium]|nr:hypothetical protein [Cytophagaceae bacterium]
MKVIANVSGFMLISMLVFLTTSCSPGEKSSSKKFVNPPFESAANGYTEMEVDAAEEKTISLPNGTKLIVPANAFVDADNNPIQGKVNIKYKEFHDAADIILSGIPMTYDSGGTTMNFQTAGMFELLGFQNGKPIFISKGKSVEVQMGSYVGENNYNFYRLDTVAKNWTYQGMAAIAPNNDKAMKVQGMTGPPVTKPIEPKPFNSDKFVFDLKINTKAYPELTDFNNIIWQYDGDSDSLNPEKNQWIFSEKWTDIKLEMKDADNSSFWLLLSNKNKSFKSQVKPVFAGRKLEEAKKNYEKRKIEYEAYLKKKKEAVERIKNECDFVRSLSVSEFGTYNHDRFYSIPDAVKVIANFETEEEVDSRTKVFCITADNRAVIPYAIGPGNSFAYSPSETNTLVAVMPGDKIAVFKDFKGLGFTSSNAPKEYTFKLKTQAQKITNSEDLRKALGI